MNRSLLARLSVVGVTCVAAAMAAGAGSAASQPAQAAGDQGGEPNVAYAHLFAAVAPPDPGIFGTSLEGAAFDSQGRFYFVDTTAPSGQPKLMSLDLKSRKVSDLYTDATSMLNCIGFAPRGVMYLCDLRGQRVASYDPATKQLSDVLTVAGVGGSAFVPDDIAVDGAGDMFVADYQGTPNGPTGRTGRIVARYANGSIDIAMTGLAHPNGIVFTADQSALWIDQDLSGTLDHVARQLSSPASTTPVATLHTASYLSLGANAYTDSLTVDGAGNIYMAVYGAGEVLEFNPDGIQIGRVVFPSSVPRVTHVAIRPGTRDAFATASGPGGGYIYTFKALAPAPADAPNGG